jgi:hypothetical protein
MEGEIAMLEEELQQYDDLKRLREAKANEADEPAMALDAVETDIDL